MTTARKKRIVKDVAETFKKRGKVLSRQEWSQDNNTPYGLTIKYITKAFRGNWGNLLGAVEKQYPEIWAGIQDKQATPKPAAKVAKTEK